VQYLTKQTVALREVSDSRLRIYEQLEVSIQDLERANHRLVLENSAGKKHIKTLTTNIEGLEARCEDLQTTIDDLRLQVDVLKKRAQRPAEPVSTPPAVVTLRHVDKYVDDSKLTSPESNITRTIQNVRFRAGKKPGRGFNWDNFRHSVLETRPRSRLNLPASTKTRRTTAAKVAWNRYRNFSLNSESARPRPAGTTGGLPNSKSNWPR
jgi:hypothetical protein